MEEGKKEKRNDKKKKRKRGKEKKKRKKKKKGKRKRIKDKRGKNLISLPTSLPLIQDTLQRFQSEMGNVAKDPFKVVMRKSHLPITLLQEKVMTRYLT